MRRLAETIRPNREKSEKINTTGYRLPSQYIFFFFFLHWEILTMLVSPRVSLFSDAAADAAAARRLDDRRVRSRGRGRVKDTLSFIGLRVFFRLSDAHKTCFHGAQLEEHACSTE